MPRHPITDAELDNTKRTFLPKMRAAVDAELHEYVLAPAPTYADLVAAAIRLNRTSALTPAIRRMKRSDSSLPGGGSIVCYDGVKGWLFAAGMATRKWLINKGILLDANRTHALFGVGAVVPPAQWGQIPAGYFWSIEKKRAGNIIDPTVCHWGCLWGMASPPQRTTRPARSAMLGARP